MLHRRQAYLPKYTRHYPSQAYLERLIWSRNYHLAKKVFDGTRSFHAFPTLRALCRQHKAQLLLDYGAGKGGQYVATDFQVENETIPSFLEGAGLSQVYCYDPAWPPFAVYPEGKTFDGVFCNDVLQHIPSLDAAWVLQDLFLFARSFLLLQVSCQMGKKPWGDAENRQQDRPEEWWLSQVNRFVSGFPKVDTLLRIRVVDPEKGKVCRMWRSQANDNRPLVYVGDGNLR